MSLARAAKVLRILLAAIGGLFVLVTCTSVTTWWAMRLAGGSLHCATGDTLIVVGAEQPSEDGLIGLTTYHRSLGAVRVWRSGVFKRMILCGGHGLAESMRSFVVCQGVPASAVDVETESRTTRENAVNAAEIIRRLHATSPVLLTSDMHMYRAFRVFRKAGVQIAACPVPDIVTRTSDWPGDAPRRWQGFLELCVETAKIINYRLRGWM